MLLDEVRYYSTEKLIAIGICTIVSFIGIQILAKKSSQETSGEKAEANRTDSEPDQDEKVDPSWESCQIVFKTENLDEETIELFKQLYDALVFEDKAKIVFGLGTSNHV